jgi:hypothetical protein
VPPGSGSCLTAGLFPWLTILLANSQVPGRVHVTEKWQEALNLTDAETCCLLRKSEPKPNVRMSKVFTDNGQAYEQ